MIAAAHGAIRLDGLLPSNQGLILGSPAARYRGQVLRDNAAEKP